MGSDCPRSPSTTEGSENTSRRNNRTSTLAWTALAICSILILGIAVLGLITFKRTGHPTTGDENSYLLQALSLYPGDFNFSFDENDVARWQDAGFEYSRANGYFAQLSKDSVYFGKPFTYSFLAGISFSIFGMNLGFSLLNLVFLFLSIGASYKFAKSVIGSTSHAALASLTFVSFTGLPFYLFAASVEAWWFTQIMLVLYLTRAYWEPQSVERGQPRLPNVQLACAYLLLGNLTAEKPPLGLLAVVGVTVLTFRKPRQLRSLLVRISASTLGLFATIAPILYYSRGRNWSPYGSPRIYIKSSDILAVSSKLRADLSAGELESNPLYGVVRGNAFTFGDLLERALTPSFDVVRSGLLFFTGENIGIFLWHLPIAMVLVAAPRILRRKPLPIQHLPVFVGAGCVFIYALFYINVYPTNFFGGAHSLGNRYILQIAPLVFPAWAILFRYSDRFVRIVAIGCFLVTIGLAPQISDVKTAYLRIDRETLFDPVLPFEDLGPATSEFRCSQAYGIELTCDR